MTSKSGLFFYSYISFSVDLTTRITQYFKFINFSAFKIRNNSEEISTFVASGREVKISFRINPDRPPVVRSKQCFYTQVKRTQIGKPIETVYHVSRKLFEWIKSIIAEDKQKHSMNPLVIHDPAAWNVYRSL